MVILEILEFEPCLCLCTARCLQAPSSRVVEVKEVLNLTVVGILEVGAIVDTRIGGFLFVHIIAVAVELVDLNVAVPILNCV